MPTGIPYVDETWNPSVGCTKCSPGCLNCFAEKMAYRLACMGQEKYQKVIRGVADGAVDKGFSPQWTGDIYCDEKALDIPLHWRKPRRILCCSMGDLFHEKINGAFRGQVFEIIRKTPRHTYLILTKRIDKMEKVAKMLISGHGAKYFNHIHWGVTICNQKEADEILPIALQIPGFDWVSFEPLLGEIVNPHLILGQQCLDCGNTTWNELRGQRWCDGCGNEMPPKIRWVVVSGESGPKARYCPVENIRGVVKQCQAAGVPVFVKQLHLQGRPKAIKDISLFPPDLRIRQFPVDK